MFFLKKATQKDNSKIVYNNRVNMGNIKVPREVTAGDVHCLENVVIAYNTMFLMSSIFIMLIAATTRELFTDFSRPISPLVLLLMVGCFIILISGLGYIGIGKKSTTIISLYTMLLIFVLVIELSAGLGILSFRRQIRSVVTSKMKNALNAYPSDPMTANLVDYVQLKFECCGIINFTDWDDILEPKYHTTCGIGKINLPSSCCTQSENSTSLAINPTGCLRPINIMFHKSSLALTSAIIAICTIQILGAYFSYSLASTLTKYKTQRAARTIEVTNEIGLQVNFNEKSHYF